MTDRDEYGQEGFRGLAGDLLGELSEGAPRSTTHAAMQLLDANLINWDEMVLLLQWTNEGHDNKEVLALAAGEFKISKEEMEDAGIATAGVGEKMKSHGEWFKNLWSNVMNVAKFTGPGIQIVTTNWAVGWIADAYPEDMEGRQLIRDAVAVVENTDSSLMTDSEKRAVINELQRIPGGIGIWQEGQAEARIEEVLSPHVEVLPDEGKELVAGVTSETGMTQAEIRAKRMETGEPVIGQYVPPAGREGEVLEAPTIYPEGSMGAYLQNTGQLATPEEQTARPVNLPTPQAGIVSPISEYDQSQIPADAWYDKSTGQVLSTEQYHRILEGQQMARSGYRPESGFDIDEFGDISGGGKLGEYARFIDAPESQLGRRARGAYQTQQGPGFAGMPGYLQETIRGDKPVPSLIADQPWEIEAYAWTPGSGRAFYDSMPAHEQAQWRQKIIDQDLTSVRDEQGRAYFDAQNQEHYMISMTEQVLGVSRGEQIDPWDAVGVLGTFNKDLQAQMAAGRRHAEALAASMAPKKQPFKIPRELRTIPDYKTIAEDVKARFRLKVGRDPTDLELDRMSGDLTGYHQRAQQRQIELAYESWEGKDQQILDSGELEAVGDPGSQLDYDIDADYGSEIDLTKRRETSGDSHNRMLRATMGSGISAPVVSGTNVVGR